MADAAAFEPEAKAAFVALWKEVMMRYAPGQKMYYQDGGDLLMISCADMDAYTKLVDRWVPKPRRGAPASPLGASDDQSARPPSVQPARVFASDIDLHAQEAEDRALHMRWVLSMIASSMTTAWMDMGQAGILAGEAMLAEAAFARLRAHVCFANYVAVNVNAGARVVLFHSPNFMFFNAWVRFSEDSATWVSDDDLVVVSQ